MQSGGEISSIQPAVSAAETTTAAPVTAAIASSGEGIPIKAPLAGTIFKFHVTVGQSVAKGDVLIILEAMKMETEIRSSEPGIVADILVNEGDSVAVGDNLMILK